MKRWLVLGGVEDPMAGGRQEKLRVRRRRLRARRRREGTRDEVVLCVGKPPTLRERLSFGGARVMVIRDVESVRPFLAKHRVSRILVDLSALVRAGPYEIPLVDGG